MIISDEEREMRWEKIREQIIMQMSFHTKKELKKNFL